VGVKGVIKKQVSLEFLNSMYKFSITKENREKLIEWIEKARTFDANSLDEDNRNRLEKYKLNIKGFKEELENAIYQLLGLGTQLAPITVEAPENPQVNNLPVNRPKHYGYNHDRNETYRPTQIELEGPNGAYPNRQVKLNPPQIFPNRTQVPNQRNFNQPRPNNVQSMNPNYENPINSPNGGRFIPNQPDYYPTDNEHINIPRYPTRNINPMSPNSPNGPMPSMGQKNYQSEERRLQNELQQLYQEEFSLNQTIRMLEQRFDSGYMNNVEYVKNYREMQKDIFRVQEKIKEISQYLKDNYPTMNN
jgi:hypothetical protein